MSEQIEIKFCTGSTPGARERFTIVTDSDLGGAKLARSEIVFSSSDLVMHMLSEAPPKTRICMTAAVFSELFSLPDVVAKLQARVDSTVESAPCVFRSVHTVPASETQP